MEHENMGALIRQLRKDRGMTQKDLAERLNENEVDRYETELVTNEQYMISAIVSYVLPVVVMVVAGLASVWP